MQQACCERVFAASCTSCTASRPAARPLLLAPLTPPCHPPCFPIPPPGFGWRERRAAFEAAMQRENRAERLVARGDLAGAEKRLQHRLLVARLEGLAFRGCTGGLGLPLNSHERAGKRGLGELYAQAHAGGALSRRARLPAPLLAFTRTRPLQPRHPSSDPHLSPPPLSHRLNPLLPAGGDSLFDALSLALWGSTLFGRRLRALAVAHAAQHPAEYSCFLGDDWQGYLRCAAQGGGVALTVGVVVGPGMAWLACSYGAVTPLSCPLPLSSRSALG